MPRPQVHGVYLVAFPFIEARKNKIRPVIVVSEPHGEHGLTLIVPITSRLIEGTTEVRLLDLETTGLKVSSSTQVHRMTTVAENIIRKQIGCLKDKDLDALKAALKLKLNL
jgi:mRNA-degrading endonuclease toxin of MazEF toxin-antitoxin module